MQEFWQIIDDADSGGCGVMVELHMMVVVVVQLFTRQPMQESYEDPPFPGQTPHTMKIKQFNKFIATAFQIYKNLCLN